MSATWDRMAEFLGRHVVNLDIEDLNEPFDSTLDWIGPFDVDNPLNWSVRKKVITTLIPSLYSFAVTYGTGVYAPGIGQIQKQFGISRSVAILGLSLYSEGLAFGPMIGAPISEAHGRKAVYMISLPVSLLFTLGAAVSTTPASLIICRFFASAFGSPSLAVGAGTVADIWELEKGGGLAMALGILAAFLGPMVGPLVGGYIMEGSGDWRWLMWSVIILGVPIFLAALFMDETSKKEILKRKAIRFGLPPPPKPPLKTALRVLFVVTLFRPIHMLLTEPIVAFMSLYVAFAFGVLFTFFNSFPYVYTRVYGFRPGQVGLAFLGVLFGCVLAVVTFVIFDRTLYKADKEKAPPGKKPPPESRLYSSMAGSLGLPISLFWFAWTAQPSINWIVPVLAGVVFGWGNVSLFLGTTSYLLDVYRALTGASALAANGLLRYTFGAIFPLFILSVYERLGIQWAGSLLGFASIALMPVPWVLYKWGPAIRAKSSYGAGN